MSWSFLWSVSSVRWKVIVNFVDICGIDDHHYLNFLFITTNNSNHSLIYDNHVYIRINSFGVIFILNCVYLCSSGAKFLNYFQFNFTTISNWQKQKTNVFAHWHLVCFIYSMSRLCCQKEEEQLRIHCQLLLILSFLLPLSLCLYYNEKENCRK